MTEKENLIEEMSKIIRKYDCCEIGLCIYTKPARYISEKCYEEGFRILPNGGIILTAEEYSDYLQLQENYRFARENIDRLQMLLGKLEDKYIRFFKKRGEIRKETAKEFYDKLTLENVQNIEDLSDAMVKTLKYFGVEVEE